MVETDFRPSSPMRGGAWAPAGLAILPPSGCCPYSRNPVLRKDGSGEEDLFCVRRGCQVEGRWAAGQPRVTSSRRPLGLAPARPPLAGTTAAGVLGMGDPAASSRGTTPTVIFYGRTPTL